MKTVDLHSTSYYITYTVKVCFVLCLVSLQPILSQSSCDSIPHSVVITTNTTVAEITMTCIVPPELELSELRPETWKWNKLAADIQMFDQQLPLTPDKTTTELNYSSYVLSVNCSQSGLYQAIYQSPNGSCVYSCLFFIEVEQVRDTVLRDVFNSYPRVDLSSPGAIGGLNSSTTIDLTNGTEALVGTCSSRFSTGLSGCIVGVSEQWFKDGETLEPRGNPLYLVSEPGDVLKILSLADETTGQYVCVTTLPLELGSFITVDIEIELSDPVTDNPISTLTTSTTPTLPEDTLPTGNGATLRTWEVGLIVANVIVVVVLVGLVSVGMACFVSRRTSGIKVRRNRKKSKESERPRPQSMVEHIQMMEEETDFVGPVEVPFSSILFEELLHKGTFKVVHHAVVNSPAQGMMSLPVAVKRLKDDKSELGTEELMGEAYTLRAVQEKAGSHPNFVSMVGMTTQGGPTCLLLEYVPHGRLDDFLTALKDGPIPEWYIHFVRDNLRGAYHKHVSGDLMRVLTQVAEGMKFLTEEGFIHRDLSTRTVLIGDRLNVKIADPGMFHEGYYYVVTEREHYLQDMAPECLWEKRYSVWSDVWSFGILAYKVVALENIPYPDATVNDLYDRMVGGERPQLLASFSNEMYFLLQRCWQFIAVERPTFTDILTDLRDMAEKPKKHIIFKAAKESGYISDTGQVFLHPLPSYALNAPSKKNTKKTWRNSGTQQSLISSVDDTMYTRETVETVIDFTQSENDDRDAYVEYLQGDLAEQKENESSSEEEVTGFDTPNLTEEKGTTRVWVESSGSKVYLHSQPKVVASDGSSSSPANITKKKKKKRGNFRPSGARIAAKKGFTNPLLSAMSAENGGIENRTKLEDNTNTNNSNLGVGVNDGRRTSDSSNGAPSITEEDTDRGGKGEGSGQDMSDQSDSTRHSLNQSQEQLIEL